MAVDDEREGDDDDGAMGDEAVELWLGLGRTLGPGLGLGPLVAAGLGMGLGWGLDWVLREGGAAEANPGAR